MTRLNGDDAVFADFTDNFGDEFADLLVASGNSGDFGDFLTVAIDFFGDFVDFFNDFSASFFNSLSEFHGVYAGGDEFVGFGEDIISKNGDSSGAVAGGFVEFLSSGFDEFGADLLAEVLLCAAEIDGFGDGDAVMGDGGGAVGFFDDDVLAFGTESDLDSVV